MPARSINSAGETRLRSQEGEGASSLSPSTAAEVSGTLPQKVRVFLVDDQVVVRKGLRLFLDLQPDISVCGDAADAPAAQEAISTLQPGVAVVDLDLEVGQGFELIGWIRQEWPTIKILVFTSHDEAQNVERAFHFGAHGYAIKQDGPREVLKAIRWLMQGGRYLNADTRAKSEEQTLGPESRPL